MSRKEQAEEQGGAKEDDDDDGVEGGHESWEILTRRLVARKGWDDFLPVGCRHTKWMG